MKLKTCCFTGQRPQNLSWGFDETDPRCVQFKARLREGIERVITERGIRHFITGMALGVDTFAAEIVLELRNRYSITLECAIPHEGQATRWKEPDRSAISPLRSAVTARPCSKPATLSTVCSSATAT